MVFCSMSLSSSLEVMTSLHIPPLEKDELLLTICGFSTCECLSGVNRVERSTSELGLNAFGYLEYFVTEARVVV